MNYRDPYSYAPQPQQRGPNPTWNPMGGPNPTWNPMGGPVPALPGPGGSSGARHGLAGWWLNLTAPPPLIGDAPLEVRERQRRAELTSWSILAVFLFLVALVSNSLADPSTGEAVGTMAVGLIIAAILNRTNHTRVAAYLVPVLLMILISAAVIEAKGGLRLIWLPAYDLLALPVFISGLIVGRRAPIILALFAIAFIVGDFLLQPHDLINAAGVINFDDIKYETAIFSTWGMINRPVGLVVFAALFGWLGARSVDWAMLRLDRAEEIARLEHAFAEQRRQLEIGVNQILEQHVRIANGDFSQKTPMSQDNVLWQIVLSLNNLTQRLQSASQSQFVLDRTNQEISRLASALNIARQGRKPIWPAPSGTQVDVLISLLSGRGPANVPPASFNQRGLPPEMPRFGPSGQSGPEYGAAPWSGGLSGRTPSSRPRSEPSFPRFPEQQPWPSSYGTDGQRSAPDSRPTSPGFETIPGLDQSRWAAQAPPATEPPAASTSPAPGGWDDNWPSLDIPDGGLSGSEGGEFGQDTPSGPPTAPFPSLESPWYLPPDE